MKNTCRLYPAPEGAPIYEGLTFFVNDNACSVYEVRVNESRRWQPDFNPPTTTAPMAYFDFEGEAELRIETGWKFRSAVIRPLRENISFTIDGNIIKFKIRRPGPYIVEWDGKVHGAFMIFANPMETDVPQPGDKDVIYYGPGLYEEDEPVTVPSGKTLYLAGGAVLRGMVRAENAENITICGRGIVDGSRFDTWSREPKKEPFKMYGCKNVRMEGIIFCDSNAWSVNSLECENVEYDNIKTITARPNGDGISFQSSRNCVVKNCFSRTWDDSLVVKNLEGNTDNILFENCYVWTDFAQSLEIGYETNKDVREGAVISNVTFRNITVFHNFHKPVLSIHNSDDALVTNIRYENITVEHADMGHGDAGKNNQLIDFIVKPSRWSHCKRLGQIRNVTVDGVTVLSGKDAPNRIRSHSRACNTENVTLKNITVLGRSIKSLEDGKFSTDKYTKNIRFE